MSSAMLTERFGNALSQWGAPSVGTPTIPAGFPGTPNCFVVPRCEMTVEKCPTGCKIICKCPDEVACGSLQNLCNMLAGGLCSCACTYNGIPCCQFSWCCGRCTCEATTDGVCITCHSGDKECCQMIQACCDCLATCLKAGCCCYLSFNNTPVCCGCC